jgi:integrase
MLKAAQQEGVAVPQRVLVAKKLPPAISDRTDIPLDQALKILRVATAREDNARWVAALLQGMRQGEALGLTWEHVDFNRATIDVAWQLQVLKYEDREQGTFKVPLNYESIQLVGGYHLVRPKSQAGTRLIPIVPWMEAALKQWQEIAPDSPWGLVFARPDGMPWSSRMDGDAWKQIQAEAGVSRPDGKPYLLHEARHTTATLLLAAGVEPEVIKAILGHSDIVTQQVYQHVNTDMTRAALEQVAGLLQLDC